jgi:hypothetical protein
MKAATMLAAIAVVLLAAVPPAAAGEGLAIGQECDAPVTDVLYTRNSGVDEEQYRLIASEEAWCAFWDEVYAFLFPRPECDRGLIDFEHEVAIVASLGSRPNACYALEISCVQDLGVSGNIRVFVTETVPDESCGCLQVVVRPVHVLKVERPVKNVQFRRETEVLHCPQP